MSVGHLVHVLLTVYDATVHLVRCVAEFDFWVTCIVIVAL